MITVVKGSSKLLVTRGTFEEQLKPLGYRIASEEKEATKKVASSFKQEKEEKIDNQEDLKQSEDKKEEEDLSEKFGLKTSKKKGK